MLVFNFYSDDETYCIAAETFQEAETFFNHEVCPDQGYNYFDEVSQKKWDKKFITTYKDDDTSTEPIKVSIRDVIEGEDGHTMLVYTTDNAFF